MGLENIRKRLILKLKKNLENGKFIIVPYSGGKDSHIATIKLIEKGYYPILIYVSLGKMNTKIFNCPDFSQYIKKVLIQEIPLLIINELKILSDIKNAKKTAFDFIINAVKQRYRFKKIYFFFIDNEMIPKDIKKIEILSKKLKIIGINSIRFSDIFPKPKIERIIKESKNYGIKSIIVNTDINKDKLIKKELNENIIKEVKRYLKEKNINPDIATNFIQTIVVRSPILNTYISEKLFKKHITKTLENIKHLHV